MTTRPALRLRHTTKSVDDLDSTLDVSIDVPRLDVTNRGAVGGGEMASISQHPSEHHQIVFVAREADFETRLAGSR
ncbi:MAG: hypothetical protein AAFZ07_16665 [Actinomycetota bacterium]